MQNEMPAYRVTRVFSWLSIFVLVAILLSLSTPCLSCAQDESVDTSDVSKQSVVKIQPAQTHPQKKSPTGAMVRSVVIPGWGQFYTKHYIKGGLIFCLETGLVLSAILEDKKAQDVYLVDYDEYLRRIDRRNGYIWWTVGVIAYSMIDAYVDAHLFNFDEDEIGISLEQTNSSPGISFVVKFPLPGCQ
jgi:hypothetical protein